MMTTTLLYLLKVTFCAAILLAYYGLFLRNRAFHRFNRFFLLAIVLLSLGLPLLRVEILLSNGSPPGIIGLLEVVSRNGRLHDDINTVSPPPIHTGLLLWLLYGTASSVLLWKFAASVCSVYHLRRTGHSERINNIVLINTNAGGTPFSFLHYIFWNTKIDLDSPEGKYMFQHELVHVRQKHTWDILFMNLVITACWWNPVFWIIKKELYIIHEYLADKESIPDGDVSLLATLILKAAYPKQRFMITSHFFYSPVKKRLTMITNNNNRPGYSSRLLLIPVLLILFIVMAFKPLYRTVSTLPAVKKYTVVIDAGHGGNDFGARADDGTLEKDITLALAQKVKTLNSNDQFDIILSRSTDDYMSPPQRVDFAAGKKADIVISIHVDMAMEPAEKNNSGIHVYLPPDSNVSRKQSEVLGSALVQEFRKNSGISVFDKMIQHKKSVWILKQASCPTVLVETGYFSSEKDLMYLQSETGQNTIAHDILSAINAYFATFK